ncbi:hypothetical protein LLF88_07305 [bacterium]|nr:hypothetical protein [bacterium]
MTGQKASSTAVHSPAHTAGSSTPYEATLSTIAEYFVDLDGHAYVVVRGQTLPVESRELADELRTACPMKTGRPVSSIEIATSVDTIGALCRKSGIVHAVFDRIGVSVDGNALYVDLANDHGEIIQVTRDGWKIIPCTTECHFVHAHGQLPLPCPTHNPDDSVLTLINPLVNLTGDSLILGVAALFGTLMPHGPYPVVVITGEQGCGKSTATRVLKQIVDPSTTPWRFAPRSPQDVAIAASRQWILAYNNLSTVQPWFSDLLCTINSGGTYSTRTLYTNAEESSLTLARPIIINGIGELVVRGDLLDRSIILKLNAFEGGRMTEQVFWGTFDTLQPAILGALLDAAVCALQHRDAPEWQIREKPRMADFAQWVVFGEEALGIPKGDFLRAYADNRSLASQVAMDDQNDLVELLVRFADLRRGWRGSIADLYAQLKAQSTSGSLGGAVPSWFPHSVRILSETLTRLAPDLQRARGISIARHRSNRGHIVDLIRTQGIS